MESEEEKKEQQAQKSEEESEIRGVHAKAHLPPNTVCMAIPRRCLITVEMGQETPIGQAILRSDLDLDAPKHIFLILLDYNPFLLDPKSTIRMVRNAIIDSCSIMDLQLKTIENWMDFVPMRYPWNWLWSRRILSIRKG